MITSTLLGRTGHVTGGNGGEPPGLLPPTGAGWRPPPEKGRGVTTQLAHRHDTQRHRLGLWEWLAMELDCWDALRRGRRGRHAA